MKRLKPRKNLPCNQMFFSKELALEFQSVLQDEYGKNVTPSEAQQIGLRIAQFVFMKEVRRREAV